MRKNLVVARNFHLLEKRALLRQKAVNIDVWPLDFMRPQQVDNYDTPTLFLLQLATILQMTSQWRKKAHLRVFLCHRQQTDHLLRRVKKLNILLNQLRIKGKVTPVVWDDALAHIDRATEATALSGYDGADVLSDLDPYALPEGYLNDVQRLLRFHSQTSALTFLYMPAPPTDLARSEGYLKFLDTITALPSPAVLVHGISIVTSTTIWFDLYIFFGRKGGGGENFLHWRIFLCSFLFLLHMSCTKQSLSWNRGFLMASRRGQIFPKGFFYCTRFAPCGLPLFQLRCRFNSGALIDWSIDWLIDSTAHKIQKSLENSKVCFALYGFFCWFFLVLVRVHACACSP